jgi:hypothetical protein
MANDMMNSKLGETVKNLLKNVDECVDKHQDWSRMESMLDNAPNPMRLTLPHRVGIAGLAIIVIIGFFIFGNKTTSTTPEQTVVETPEQPALEATSEKPVVSMPRPAVTKSVVPEVKKPLVKTEPDLKLTTIVAGAENKKIKEEPTTVEKRKEKSKAAAETKDSNKTEANTEPETKKTTNNSVGFGSLLNLNLDSIKKQKEQIKADTVK